MIILWQPPNLTRTSPVPPLTQAQNQKTVTMRYWRQHKPSCTACNRPAQRRSFRVNVGVMQAGSDRNVVPASALLKVETRGASDVINQYVFDRAQQAIQGAATMYGVGVETRLMGAATASSPSPQWVAWLQSQAAQVAGVNQAIERVEAPAGSEDATLMMARVQQHQGQASYVVFGTQLAAGHHNEKFDFDEQVLAIAVETLARTALNFPWTRGI
ncbi:M20/M25/M40 family metallo-hydrolase [Escherichia coli]|nr:M20/M25/M40 family metallo-hydrolase [Escherichia coli]